MLMSSHTYSSVWVVQGESVPSRRGLVWDSWGRQEGTRWRPLQIWLLLTVLWSAHVYLLSQHWYLGLCGAWDIGPRLLWSEVDPSDYACGNCAFSLSFLWLPPPYLLSPFFFSPPIFFLTKLRFGGCRWGAFNVIVCLFTSPLWSQLNKVAKSKIHRA